MASAESGDKRQSRILKEKADLIQHFDNKDIRWTERTVELDVKTFNGKQYTLQLCIPDDFPNSYPSLAVINPKKLQQPNGSPILPNTAIFRTLGLTQEGFQSISHYPSDNWQAGHFIHQIFKKGVFWVKAYEEYLATGESIDHYLRIYCQATCEIPAARCWSETQLRRLAREKEQLDEFYGPDKVKWTDEQMRKVVDVSVQSLQNKDLFTFRVYLSDDFPSSYPELAIIFPEELLKVNGEPLPENSLEFHTLGRKDGHLEICHFGSANWMDCYNITSVIGKGQAWVNAYEHYLLKKDLSFKDCLCMVTQSSEDQ